MRTSVKTKEEPYGSQIPWAQNPGLRQSSAGVPDSTAQTVTALGGGVHRAVCIRKNKTESFGLGFIFGGDEG